ncbi:hypothetical protein LY78DRAFT_480759 [Colletotrichum sublineola]|nr:hypothetical protein LY78DRAFT_480759 [Colletotrichum sublineola]
MSYRLEAQSNRRTSTATRTLSTNLTYVCRMMFDRVLITFITLDRARRLVLSRCWETCRCFRCSTRPLPEPRAGWTGGCTGAECGTTAEMGMDQEQTLRLRNEARACKWPKPGLSCLFIVVGQCLVGWFSYFSIPYVAYWFLEMVWVVRWSLIA